MKIRFTGISFMRSVISCNRGFTLVEMLIVTALFIIVLVITGYSLNTIFGKSVSIQSSEESNTEGIVGLELLRHDLQQAGFGLFSDETSIPTYPEAANPPYTNYNDADAVPRAIVTGNDLKVSDIPEPTDYLSIKATTVARSSTSQLWTYVTDTGLINIWGRDDFRGSDDKLIVLEQTVDKNTKLINRRLVQRSKTNYMVSYAGTSSKDFTDQNNAPTANTDDPNGFYTPFTGKMYYLFGIDNISSGAFTPRAPFNRADYFITRDDSTPASCSKAAGVLYKAVMNQDDGGFNKVPIMDCVANMQVVLGWNTSVEPEKSSDVDAYTNADGSSHTGSLPPHFKDFQSVLRDPMEVRRRLRLVMVYFLAQDGRRDKNFVNTNTGMLIGDATKSNQLVSKPVDLTKEDFAHYRWKLYRVVVRPKNLF